MVRKKLRGAVVQVDCQPGKVTENVELTLTLARNAISDHANVVVLPELFNTGYGFPEYDPALAEKIPGPTSQECQKLANETGALIVGAIIEKAGNHLYDTAFICRPNRRIQTYRKVHLWKGEEKRFRPGRRLLPPVLFQGARVGVLICHDLRYAEAARTLALMGADILVYPSAFGAARFYSWDIQTRARAMENGVFAMFANRTGQDKDIGFAGHSRIVDPYGKPLVDLAEGVVGYTTADIDLEQIRKARTEVPQLPQLNPVVYRYLNWGPEGQSRSREAKRGRH